MKFEFKEHTDKGLVREVNEDNLGHQLNSVNGDIFVVCDGMGGHVGGKTASTIGVNSIIAELTKTQHGNMHVAISQALTFANEQVLGYAAAEPSLKGMGSTATVALIKDDLLYVGHVGDSRAYIFSDGKLFRITRDDSYVQGLVDSGVITEDEAETHPNKNRILQALGSTSAIAPRIPSKPFKLKTGDLLLLCSDGLTSMVVDELIEQLIDPNNLQGTLSKLHEIAMGNGGKDNITMTLIKITDSPFAQNDFDHYTLKYKKVSKVSPATITGNPPPIDFQPEVKKKQPMGLMLGAAAALLVIVVGYVIFNNGDKEKPPVAGATGKDTTKVDTVKTEVFTQQDTDATRGKKTTKPDRKVSKLQPLIYDSTNWRSKLQKILDEHGGSVDDPSKDCSKCKNDSILALCKSKVLIPRSRYKKACKNLEKARKKSN